jgi:hypothetical protein
VFQNKVAAEGLVHCLALHPTEKKVYILCCDAPMRDDCDCEQFALGLDTRAQVYEYDTPRGEIVFTSNVFDCAVTCVALSAQA